jgi:hypothetical protein
MKHTQRLEEETQRQKFGNQDPALAVKVAGMRKLLELAEGEPNSWERTIFQDLPGDNSGVSYTLQCSGVRYSINQVDNPRNGWGWNFSITAHSEGVSEHGSTLVEWETSQGLTGALFFYLQQKHIERFVADLTSSAPRLALRLLEAEDSQSGSYVTEYNGMVVAVSAEGKTIHHDGMGGIRYHLMVAPTGTAAGKGLSTDPFGGMDKYSRDQRFLEKFSWDPSGEIALLFLNLSQLYELGHEVSFPDRKQR